MKETRTVLRVQTRWSNDNSPRFESIVVMRHYSISTPFSSIRGRRRRVQSTWNFHLANNRRCFAIRTYPIISPSGKNTFFELQIYKLLFFHQYLILQTYERRLYYFSRNNWKVNREKNNNIYYSLKLKLLHLLRNIERIPHESISLASCTRRNRRIQERTRWSQVGN